MNSSISQRKTGILEQEWGFYPLIFPFKDLKRSFCEATFLHFKEIAF